MMSEKSFLLSKVPLLTLLQVCSQAYGRIDSRTDDAVAIRCSHNWGTSFFNRNVYLHFWSNKPLKSLLYILLPSLQKQKPHIQRTCFPHKLKGSTNCYLYTTDPGNSWNKFQNFPLILGNRSVSGSRFF